MSSFADRIAELKDRAHDVAAQIVALAERRRQHSLDAAIGDKRAVQAIADLDAESDALKRQAQTLSAALELAEIKEREAAAELKAIRRREQEEAAYSAARAIVTLNEELDLALIHLREMFERRAILLRSLTTVDPNLIMRLSNRAGPTSAAHAAGLGRHLNLEMTPVVAQRPLADANALLLGIGITNGRGNGNSMPRIDAANKRG
jgi:hypothetical protein